MLIMNTTGDGKGAPFDRNGDPKHPLWPINGYLRCPRQTNRALMQCLVQAEWGEGKICAGARWTERQEDEPKLGPEFTKGTYRFGGNGILFYFYTGGMPTESNTSYLCGVPWWEIFKKNDNDYCFVGEERMRAAFLDRADRALRKHVGRMADIEREYTHRGLIADRLRFTMETT